MRNALAEEITALAEHDTRIVLLSGDIGNRLFDEYKASFPDRFYNCGVAEANMTGVAAGMALSGLRPITYTITPFNTLRCLEQIKIDVCYHNVPVTIVGVGAGLSYSELGGTHQGCDDIAVLRTLPNMKLVCPGDSVEVRLALRAILNQEGPAYLRLGKKGEPVVHQREPAGFEIGKAMVVQEGDTVCFLSTGNLLPVTMEAASVLQRMHVSPQVVSFHTVKPLDEAFLLRAFSSYELVVTLEEHGIIGGFGSAVAEWRSVRPEAGAQLCCIGTPNAFPEVVGDHQDARALSGLTAESIAQTVMGRL